MRQLLALCRFVARQLTAERSETTLNKLFLGCDKLTVRKAGMRYNMGSKDIFPEISIGDL